MGKHIEYVTWNKRQRHLLGWPSMGRVMMNVLIDLYNAKVDDAPFQAIKGVHLRTVNFLLREDWIFASKGVDGIRYKITGRGERVMKAYLRPVHRFDGICPDCGERPRHVRSSGALDPYCLECGRAAAKRKRRLGIVQRVQRLCSRCRQRPNRRYPNGTYSSYCEECDKTRSRERMHRERAARAARVRAGEYVKCKRKGCAAPVHHSERYVYDLCHAHLQQTRTAMRDRLNPDSQAARARRYKKPTPTAA